MTDGCDIFTSPHHIDRIFTTFASSSNFHDMKVSKFGGTSVGSAKAISSVKDILLRNKEAQCVVVSAVGGITDTLETAGIQAAAGKQEYHDTFKYIESKHLGIISELIAPRNRVDVVAATMKLLNNLEDLLHGIFLIKEFTQRSRDLALSYGERLSSTIIAAYLSQEGSKAIAVDSRELVRTDETFGSARVDFKATNSRIRTYFKDFKGIAIVTGFIASTRDGVTTTLGRGGSDYTCAIFAAALNAAEIEIWTDVDGVMTADPREVNDAFSLGTLSYNEAMELSYFGAKVIHPPTLQPAISRKIPLRIKNTFNPDFEGTVIRTSSSKDTQAIKGISSVRDISLVSIVGSGMVGVPGVSSRLFGALSQASINVILISQASSEHSICFAISPNDSVRAEKVIRAAFELEISRKKIENVIVENDLSIVAVVGENMKHTPGISGKLFHALGNNGVNVVAIAQGSSEINISVVIGKSDLRKALNLLHEAFFLSEYTHINMFLVGTGLIGSTLIDQIQSQDVYLKNQLKLSINILGIANSRNSYFQPKGVNLKTWRSRIDKKGPGVDLSAFVDQMIQLNVPNSVFVDCTSNGEVTSHYRNILDNSISIVTPNKLANSGTYANYTELKQIAADRNVKFLFETNVGAGLPVIRTLNDLTFSGDQVSKIEGVLSGTLSYIFNSFDGTKPFSQVVKEAKESGFTEPDPRDDLSGEDVKRKILILGREAGFILEPSDVRVKPFLPRACFTAKSIPAFFKALQKNDAEMEKMVKKAISKGKVLRYIASLEKGKAIVELKTVDGQHPFYSLSGSDNVISFVTKRYMERPLVVKGPGAGADVTAAGVFSEVIAIGNYMFRS